MAKKRRTKKYKTTPNAKIFTPPPKRLVPADFLLQFVTPLEQELTNLNQSIPQEGTLEAAKLQWIMNSDIRFQYKWEKFKELAPLLRFEQAFNGSGLQMSKLLRWYTEEYSNRLAQFGFDSLPTSSRLIQYFLYFDRAYLAFRLKPEKEHILGLEDYFNWYTTRAICDTPTAIENIMEEGVVYSYDMISEPSGICLSAETKHVIAGVSFIRYGHKLSCILLAGENPPTIPDEQCEHIEIDNSDHAPGRRYIHNNPDLTTKDRYLDGYTNFSKIILLTTFDLYNSKYYARYLFQDVGSQFVVSTDDTGPVDELSLEDYKQYRDHTQATLARYSELFSALASLIYLPLFFTIQNNHSKELEVATYLSTEPKNPLVKKLFDHKGKSNCTLARNIKTMPQTEICDPMNLSTITPPDFQCETNGFWKHIGPHELGQDEQGKAVIGRTWVTRHESWSAIKPHAFLVRRVIPCPTGPDPGTIYVQRSPALEINAYKVGLTRRSVEVRAKELSSASGVPLPFEVIAKWEVGDCANVEKQVHIRLQNYRLNPNREFFVAEIQIICRVINDIVEKFAKSEQ